MTFDPTSAVPDDQFDPTTALPESAPSTREVIKTAVTFNPDQAAQADQLRKKYPLPPDTLVRNLQNVQLQELVDKHDRTLQTSPKLSQYMRERPWLAAQAHDDIEPLKQVESSFAALGAAGAGQAVLGISESIWRTPDAAQRLVGYLASIPEMVGLPQYLNPIRGVQDAIRIFSEGRLPVGPKFMSGTTDVANMVGRGQDILAEDRATFGDAFADLGVLSKNADQALRTALETGQVDQLRQVVTDPNYWAAFMGQAVPSLYAAIKSGGSVAFMGWLEGMEQASSAADFEARTGVKVTDAEFAQATMQTALVNAFLEKAGLDKVLGAQGRGLKGIIAAMGSEGGTEALQQINTNLAALLAYDEGRSLLEGVVSSFMGGVGSGGGVATVTNAAAKAQEVLDQRLRQGEDATRHAEKLTAAMQAAAQSKLRERNPETFKQLMQQMATDTDGAPKTVFIDAQVLAQSGVDVAQMFPSAAEQMEGALATNSMVEVDIGEVLTAVPGTPLEQVFLQNARATETSLSLAEVQQAEAQAQEFIQQEAERVLQEAQDQEAWQASSQAVQQTILDQLNATGRFTPDVNEAYAQLQANFFSTMAARVGLTPEQMYQDWSLRVAARGMGGNVLNAGAPAVSLGGRQIPITLNRQDERAGFRLVPVNVAAFDAGFRAADNEFQAEMYVGPGGTGAAIGDRYQRFGEFASTAESIEAPTVSVDAQGRVSFGNGRHRFAFMRDNGLPSVPVAMDEESLQNAINAGYVSEGVLNQAAVERLTSMAERGERATGSRAVITPEEKAAIKESAEKVGISVAEITRAVREHKLAHPTAQGWAPLVYNRTVVDDGKVTHEYKATAYDFSNDKEGKQLEPGTPDYRRRVNAVARSMVDEVRRVFTRANAGDKNAQNILAQAGWYKAMRSRLRQEFGGLGDLFADLLGATSPNTPVRDNWTNAVDALRRASRGDFDALIPQWEAWADKVDELELDFRGWFNERVAEGLTKKAIKALPEYKTKLDALKEARKLPDNLLPTKETGKKYGFNGRNVARAMVDLWRVVKNADPDIARGDTAPKALNFSGNLIGFRERATIDVWAARMLQRLAGGLRIPSMAETGVSGAMREDGTTTLQFGFGQDVFGEAVKRIRADAELKTDKTLAEINDDDLQAVVWFVEKELWTVNNWTNAAGEGGSFELEANLTGPADQVRIRELRRIIDSSKSKPEAKAQAREQLAALERTVDRFVGGLSVQMSADTQGTDYVPTDADMARLGHEIRTAIYEADDGSTVLASKALATEGRYGGVERSLDLEVVTREGYDANALWLEMLRQAQAAKQDSTFLSRVLRDNEQPDPLRHRPGVEIYFREAAAQAQLEQVLADLAKEGVEFLTVIVDGRRLGAATEGEMPPAVGVRLQYVPEFEQRYGMDDFSGLDDVAIAAKIQQKAIELEELAHRVSLAVDGVSFAGQFWYDTQVAFSAEYQEKIDGLTARTAEGEPGPAGAEVPWAGQSVQAGIESANRQARETAGGQPDSGGVLGGDALGSDPGELNQGPRGTFNPQELLITLNENADLSTFLHESGHFFLEVLADLASQPNAPQQIVDDMATALAWFGVPDLATWNSYTLDQKRQYHERWAESFEQYLFEGKAPSQELQPLFRRFRSWLVNVYKSLTQFMQGRDLKVSDDVRKVFDRLIATDEQIAQAEAAAGLLPDFEATNEAIEKLQARSLRDLKWTVNARNKTIKALQKEAATLRKGIEAEVRAEVQAQPLYAAMTWLKKGEMVDPVTGDQVKAEKGFRLNTEALAEMYPETMLGRPDLTRLKGMTGKAGLHPDIVADMFGFESGDALVRNLIDAEPMASVVEGMTDQRMLERHGDLVDPQAIEAAANEAVHNEARARSLATELKSQSEMMNQRQDTGRTASNGRPITVNAITAAAKEFAANLAARRRIKDLRNAAWQHRAAEARAGKAWQQATAKGETQAAVQAKRDQVLNNATVKALQDAQAEVKKIVEFFRRVTKDSNEKTVEKGRDPDVVNAMRAILAAYGVAPRLGKSALEYMEAVAKNDPAMYGALKPGVDAALFNAKPLPEMTVEELRGLNDELRAMWALAKRSRQMEVDGNLLDIEEAADELVNRMEVLGIPLEIPGERGSITEKEERGIKLQFAKAILSRVEQWAERLDGKFGGPFLRLVFQPIKDAADRYRTDRVEYRKKFTALLQAIAPVLPAGPVQAPELGYTFGNARDSGMAEVLHALLHTGNESNKRKLLLGRGWAVENDDGTLDTARWDAFIDRLVAEGKLGKAHYDFAQGVWDLLEQMKPLAQETHRKVFGRYFAEVTADAFVTPFGTYRGGYVPAQTDSRIVRDAKLRELADGENESMAYAFPSSPNGFTKARVEYNKPLLLDLRALAQHMDKVLLFSHMQGAVTDVRRLLTNKRVSYALDRLDPGAYEGMLIPWLNRSAKQIVETPVAGDRKLSRFLSASRSRAGMALMFANLSNTFQQITGFSTAAVKVKPSLMVKAAAEFTRSPKAVKQRVAEMSAYMKDRMLNEVSALNDVVEEIMLDPTMLERGQAWTQRHAYFLQAAVDNTMSPIIWQAAFNQASEQGMSTTDAVRFADGVVRQTQGTTLPEDVSRFETGPAYGRLFTQFIGYFNMMANTNATAMKQIVDEMGLRKGAGKLLYVALMGLLVPIWVAEAIAQGMRGGPDDEDDDGYLDDWLAAVFGFGTIRGLVAMIPGVAQVGQLAINRFNDNPADDKFSLSPAVSLIESSVSAPFSVYNAIAEEGSAQKAIRDTAAAATLITGLPFFAAARPLGYAAGVAQDKIDPTGPADFTRGLVTGTASPESRTP